MVPEGRERKTVDCPSGRKLEYRLLGRCDENDPFVLSLHGKIPAGMGMLPATDAMRLCNTNTDVNVLQTLVK